MEVGERMDQMEKHNIDLELETFFNRGVDNSVKSYGEQDDWDYYVDLYEYMAGKLND